MSASSLLFVSPRRLRAPWRIGIFIATSYATFIVASSLAGLFHSATAAFGSRLIVYNFATALALVLSTFVAIRWIDSEPWSYVKLNARAAQLDLIGVGLLIGTVAIGIPSLLLLATYELRVLPGGAGSWMATAGRMALVLFPAALIEELLFRGYLFAVLRDGIGWKGALIVSSIAFGALHAANPYADAQSILVVTLAGFMLGLIVLVTDSLYAAWMAHFAWNWTLAGALHTSVSGLGIETPGYRVVDNGPRWLTGGGWGPEGGFAAAAGIFIFSLILQGRYMNRLRAGSTMEKI